MQKKITIIFTTITIILAITAGLFYIKNKQPAENITPYDIEQVIKTVTKNTLLLDANTDHNQALDVSQYANKNNIELPEIIVNFDTHSDIYLNDPGILPESGVEDWINEYIAKNPKVNTLYWVIPDEEAQNLIMQIYLAIKIYDVPKEFSPLIGNCLKTMNPFHFAIHPLSKENFSQNFLIDPETKMMNEYIKGNELNKKLFKKNVKYKKVKIITCTKDSLPDFNGKKVFLSIDADYMSNSGFDTTGNFSFIKSNDEIDYTFYSIFKTVKDKHMTPVVISMSLSPQYLPKSKHKYVDKIFKQAIEYSGLKDVISEYTHRYDPSRYE